ncbi:response regulator [Wukongibacter sp. M2B1]
MIEIDEYDLVVLDINLADIDGLTILESLRENNQKTRVIKNPTCGGEGQH